MDVWGKGVWERGKGVREGKVGWVDIGCYLLIKMEKNYVYMCGKKGRLGEGGVFMSTVEVCV